jgi:homogentisate 1,2-dioxygenase
LGLIGANGLANPLHFEFPHAWIDNTEYKSWSNVIKLGGEWFSQDGLKHSPYDVAAWKGNYAPYRYDLRRYIAVNSVTVDHPDPSIFTVLSVPSPTVGVAACDFVIFPPRWMVADHTFRPPYFHRNVMCEFMGLIRGSYDGKKKGFIPGGASLHNRLVPHGPDEPTHTTASHAELKPVYYDSGLAFMFETAYLLKLSEFAREGAHRERDYADCWKGLSRANL